MQYIEVEQKFAVADPTALQAKLRKLGATPSESSRQVDTYYNAPHKDFTAPAVMSDWLRVRTADAGSSVNFKRWHPVEAITKTHADKFESPVGDVTAVAQLLEALDFAPLVTVDKTRTTWTLPDVEVVFDDVAGVGDFVGFEYKANAATVEQALDELQKFIDNLGVELGERIEHG